MGGEDHGGRPILQKGRSGDMPDEITGSMPSVNRFSDRSISAGFAIPHITRLAVSNTCFVPIVFIGIYTQRTLYQAYF